MNRSGHRLQRSIQGFVPVFWIILTLSAKAATAMQIPVGLDWQQQVFVQEYWRQGLPYYCVSNLRSESVQIQVSRWLSRNRPSQPVTRWRIDKGAYQCFDAKALQGKGFLELNVVDGPRLGLLFAPDPSLAPEGVSATKVSSFRGLNGVCPYQGIWVEQDEFSFAGASLNTLTLVTPAGKGSIQVETVPGEEMLPLLKPENVHAPTLPVRMQTNGIEIDTNHPREKQPLHRIQFDFRLPLTNQATLYQFSARIRLSNQQHGCLVRGIAKIS